MISSITKQIKGAFLVGALLMGSSTFAQLGLAWGEMGPNDVAGRCRAIIVDKTDATGNRMFAAGVSGGVFRTTDAGANWSPVNDLSPSLIVSSMSQDVAGNIYFGTGETFGHGGDGAGSSGFRGTGLYKINASSTTISQLKDSTAFGDINEVAVDNSNVIYIAGQKGFFISTDGGTTFTEEAQSITSGLAAMDVKVAKNGDIYYSAGVKSFSTSQVYYAAFGSSSYANITPTVIANRGRIEIAPSPADANYVYLSIAKMKTTTTTTNGGLSAIMVSDNKGITWATISIGTAQFDPLTEGTKGFGDYSNTIAADPIKKDACFIGGQLLFFWSQLPSNPLGQGTSTQIGEPLALNSQIYLHGKIHDLKFTPGSNTIYYVATDGGIFKSFPLPTGYPLQYTPFLPYNKGFNITQFNAVAATSFPRVTGTSTLAPYAGVAGGSIGNSLVYLPGNLNNDPMTSNSFGSTDAYQMDFSKIVPKALFFGGTFGTISRTNDIDATAPSTFYEGSYKGAISGSSPGSSTFANENTPFRLWENLNNTDSAIFYNETIKSNFANSNTTKTVFLNSNVRPQAAAKYDTILITMTSSKLQPTVAIQSIAIMPVYTGTAITSLNVTGDTPGATSNTVYVNASLTDSVRYTFNTPPNDSSKIYLTYKLRYDIGDVITITNKDISGANFQTSVTLTVALGASVTPQPVVKLPLKQSARFATGITNTVSSTGPSVYAVKRALNFAVNPDWVKIAGKNSRIDSAGVPSKTVAPILGTTVTRLEWAPNGACIYFSTKLNDTTFYLYRISHLEFIGDSASADYSGLFTSDVDSTGGAINKSAPQRTTPLGKFKNPITGIAVSSDNMNVMITCGSYKNSLATVYYSNSDTRTMVLNNTDASNFSAKNGSSLPMFPAYTGIFEMSDNKRAIVGTETGVYSTTDITAVTPSWTKEAGTANNFPNVPVFQLRQQTLAPWQCYNSGVIYAATHGRGIWSSDKFFTPYAIGVQELEKADFGVNTNIRVYPNPAADATNLWFKTNSEASYKITVYDINGRVMLADNTGKLAEGTQMITLNTAQLTSGIYFVSVSGTNNFTANTKLVITH